LIWISPILEALLQVALDRIMFSADHPHQSMTGVHDISRWFTAHAT
jgi:predicted TIM-barrel fold metal-dependent hydrolase